jgi:glyoxylase-like metal-dependent hydrolase (beta-lactamase superfamily II)
VPDCAFEEISTHVDRFSPDDRTDRPALGAVHGDHGTLLVEGGASVAHLRAFTAALAARNRPPVVAIALTHWHWDHSFGSAAVDAPVIAHRGSAAALAIQAAYEWSDAALDERVRDGREIQFCADMIKLELPDRSDLRIVVPTETYADRHAVDLGGVTAVLQHVGGDHASDSCVVHVPGDGALFLGDCLYQRLHAPEPLLTVAGVRALLEELARFDVGIAIEGHDDNVADADAYAARRATLLQATELVESSGLGAAERAAHDADLAEIVQFLLVGEGHAGAGRGT